ncbi:MAG TPA: hypothetical protein VHO91_10815 [Rhodopila sp.]|nr:hypothetical protein [Rhodopila sp.]
MNKYPEHWPALLGIDFIKRETGLSQGVRIGARRTAWHAAEVWDYLQSRPRVPVKGPGRCRARGAHASI